MVRLRAPTLVLTLLTLFLRPDGHGWPLDYSHPDILPLYELLRLHETMTGVELFNAPNREWDFAFDASIIQLLLPPHNQR